MPKLLVCCEESQRVCMAFRERGWEALSLALAVILNGTSKKMCCL